MDGSATLPAIGAIADPTVRSTGWPTGTAAVSGVTTIGGGVPVGTAGAAGDAVGNDDCEAAGDGDCDGAGVIDAGGGDEGGGVCADVAATSAKAAKISP